jgi:hypothetical protein
MFTRHRLGLANKLDCPHAMGTNAFSRMVIPRLRSGFRQRAQTPARRLNLNSRRLWFPPFAKCAKDGAPPVWLCRRGQEPGHPSPLKSNDGLNGPPVLERMICWFLHQRFTRRSRFWQRRWSEHEIFRIPRLIARQRLRGFLANPDGNGKPIWLIDAPDDVQENRYPLNTCLLRGWIEELAEGTESYKGFPIAQPLGSIDEFPKPPYYRLTTAGWNALKRQYAVSKLALLISATALMVSFVSFIAATSRRETPPSLRIVFPAPTPPR